MIYPAQCAILETSKEQLLRAKPKKKDHEMNSNIEIIEDNAGGLTIQNTETKAVAYFEDKSYAIDSIKSLLEGEDMSGWDTSDPEYYITDEKYQEHASSGGYTLWSEEDAKGFVA